MRKVILRSLVCFTLAVALLMSALAIGGMYLYFDNQLKTELKQEASMISALIETSGDAGAEAVLQKGAYVDRVTLVAGDGTVLYDNHTSPTVMSNHLEREEIKQALETGEGESRRASETVGEISVYYALRLEDGRILRVSGNQKTVGATVWSMGGWVLLGAALSVLLAALVARPVTRKLVRPINDINLDEPLKSDAYEEFSPMLRRMDAQHKRIEAQFTELKARHSELDAIISSMREGLVLLDAKRRVLSVNRAARGILGIGDGDVNGRALAELNRHETILRLLKTTSDSANGELCAAGRTYRAFASVVPEDGGMILLLQDVTEELAAEESRRQFTGNVSHELRTPLTTVSGYAEMLSMGMTDPADVQVIGSKIYHESRRLLQLIEDIMRLSKLDEGVTSEFRRVDLLEVAKGCTAKLEGFAESKQVTIDVRGESVDVLGDEALLGEMLTNLIENGVKYNHDGGSVTVRVGETDGKPCVSVTDTGVGIAPEHQARVFERFYRVDKSRSKETGGTGLGLSIVKHGAQVHGAKLDLQSEPNKGTTITLTFERR